MRKWVIHELLADAALHYPDVEVISGTRRFTYATEWDRVVRLAHSLQSLGVKKGTVVGVLDINSHRYFELQYALSLVGAVVHTLNFRLPAADLLYTVQHAGDEFLFIWEGFQAAGQALQPHVRKVVWMPDETPAACAPGEILYEDLITAGNPMGTPDADVDETDTYSIFYTTGTTGRPKGLRYRHRDMIQAPLQIAHHLAVHDTGAAIRAGDTIMPLIPFFHIHGWGTPFFAPYLGSKLVLPERSDAAGQLQLIRKEGVTWSNMVPTQLHMLLAAAEQDESVKGLSLRVLTGGSPLPSGLALRADRLGVQFSLIYGGSDQLGTGISALTRHSATDDRLRTLSTKTVPLPMVRMEVRDTEGRRVPQDGSVIGEIWVQSPWLPDGYLNDPDRSRESYVDGWFRTGDLGVWFEDGSFHVLDRQKDAVKSGGEWIATSVIEAILSELDGVEMAAVLAVPDETWGERPLTVLQCKDGLTEEHVRTHLRAAVAAGRLAKFWVPDKVIFVDAIPITSAGKIHKTALRQSLGIESAYLHGIPAGERIGVDSLSPSRRPSDGREK
jgi:fatty-acyl-CoA synthase